MLVDRAVAAPFRARPVVGQKDDERVVELADVIEERQEPTDLGVGVGEKAGEHLLRPGVHAAGIRGQVVPGVDPRRPLAQHGAGRYDTGGQLALERPLPPSIPAAVEPPAVGGDPFLGDVVGCVGRSQSPVQEERLLSSGVLLVEHVANGVVGQILGEVVPLLGPSRRVDVVVVADQVRSPVIGVALQEAVVALEAESERPPVERPCQRPFPPGYEVPLAHRHGVVAGVAQDAGQRGRRCREASVVAGEGQRHVDEESHSHRMVVPPRQEARPGRGAECCHMEPVVAEPLFGQAVHVGRRHVGAERAQLGKPGVVEKDHDDVRRIGWRSR